MTPIRPAMPEDQNMDTYLPTLTPDQGLFSNVHVRTMLCTALVSGTARCILLNAEVNPSQKEPDRTHEA